MFDGCPHLGVIAPEVPVLGSSDKFMGDGIARRAVHFTLRAVSLCSASLCLCQNQLNSPGLFVNKKLQSR